MDEMSAGRFLPEGLVQGCTLTCDIAKDAVITYDDVILPSNRLADRLRAEQYRHFRHEAWLEDIVNFGESNDLPQCVERLPSSKVAAGVS